MRYGDDRLPSRFWDKVTPADDGCWIWTGARIPAGYGQFRLGEGRAARGAHRVAYVALVGPVSDRLVLDHLCRNRACVNPGHLHPCTHRENILAPGSLSVTKQNAERTHCVNGHPFDEWNTYIRGDGGRYCRECGNARQRAWRRRKQEATA